MKRVAFVPIRLNSQRVEGKNLRELGGRPLMTYLLETLTRVENIDEVYVYCSNPDVQEFFPNDKIKFLQRSVSLDQNTTTGNDILKSFANDVDADIYLLAHATAPFVSKESFEKGLKAVYSGEYDSAFAAEKMQDFLWKKYI